MRCKYTPEDLVNMIKTPIPKVFCEFCGTQKVPSDPYVSDIEYDEDNGTPLICIEVRYKCPKAGWRHRGIKIGQNSRTYLVWQNRWTVA